MKFNLFDAFEREKLHFFTRVIREDRTLFR